MNFQNWFLSIAFFALISGCASDLPEEHHDHYDFPSAGVYIDLPTGKDADRPYEALGWVRGKAHYPTMEQESNNPNLCKNYYNKAAGVLLKEAKKAKADAVIQVRSIVMLMDTSIQEYKTPECSDDGAEGEILLKGIAIRYKPVPEATPTPIPSTRQGKKPHKPMVAPN